MAFKYFIIILLYILYTTIGISRWFSSIKRLCGDSSPGPLHKYVTAIIPSTQGCFIILFRFDVRAVFAFFSDFQAIALTVSHAYIIYTYEKSICHFKDICDKLSDQKVCIYFPYSVLINYRSLAASAAVCFKCSLELSDSTRSTPHILYII